MRITSKIVIFVSVSVAIVMGVVSWISVQQTKEALYTEIHNLLISALDSTAERLNRNSLAAKKTSEIIAHNPAISKALSLDESVGVNQILNQMLEIYPFYNYIMIVWLDGDIFAVNTTDKKGDKIAGEELLGLNVMKTPLFLPPTNSETVVGAPGPDPYLSLLGIKVRTSQWFVAPILKGPVPIGWVVLSYDWQEELSSLLTRVSNELISYGNPVLDVAIVDEKGKVFVSAHSFNEEFMQSPDQVWKEKHLSFGKGNMKLIITSDRTKIDEPITTMRNFFIGLISVATIILLSLLYFILQRTFLVKLKIIQQGSSEFRSGNLAHRLPSLGHDELGLLASTFNEMGQSLQDASQELELKVAERTAELRENEAKYRMLIEEDLHKKTEILRSMFEASPEAIIVLDPQGIVKMWNPSAERIFGWTESEALGCVHPIVPDSKQEEFNMLRERVLRGESFSGVELTRRRKDGTAIEIRVSTVPLKGPDGKVEGILSVNSDITERKRNEEQLRQSEDKFSKAFLLSPDPMTITRAIDGVFVSVNKGFCQVFGYAEQEVIGRPTLKLNLWDDPKDRDRYAEKLKTEGKVDSVEYRFRNKKGDILNGLVSGSIIYLNGLPHILTVAKDITDRKRAEEERLKMEVERRVLHAQKFESLAVMAGGIAHDFNNQLAVVLGNLELALMDMSLDTKARHSIENAIQAAKRSAELSRQMQIYTGNTLYYPVDLDLNELLNRNLGQLKFCLSKNVTLNFQSFNSLPLIKGDPDQIQRLVMNILVNASEAIGNKDGEVRLSTGAMDCDEAYLSRSRLEGKPTPGRFVFLEVTDTGCGMDAETQHKLFDPFFTTKFCGRGLGMAEVIGIVKGHHGTIMVDSEVGKRTTIRVLLPVTEVAQRASVQVIDVVETKTPAPDRLTGRKTILLVEDEPLVRDLAVKRLELLGYESITAVDGEEGVLVFRERLNEVDLVMLDFVMPKMNGVEAFGELIRIKPDVKVILCSGYTEDVVLESFPGQRPAGVLHKPYNMEDLKGELVRLLGTAN